MDLREQLAALFLGNAPHEDTIGTTAVEIPFYHHVAFSQSYYALSGHILIRKDVVFQVVPDLGDPCIGTVTPRPTDSTGEFEDCSDEVEELCISELKKCLRVPEEQAQLKGLDLTYTEHPVKILETSEKVTRHAE